LHDDLIRPASAWIGQPFDRPARMSRPVSFCNALVMAGLVPAIHVFAAEEGVDARHKAGHDHHRPRMCSRTAAVGQQSSVRRFAF